MSVEIQWEALTTGPEGEKLAETIRLFIHDRFQQIQLPRFIRSVNVHSFNFGDTAPEIEVKDICDPLPDFYEDDDAASDASHEGSHKEDSSVTGRSNSPPPPKRDHTHHHGAVPAADTRHARSTTLASNASNRPKPLTTENMGNPFFSFTQSAIPGGTSNLTNFHLPYGAGFSGPSTPLAAMAGGHFAAWPDLGSQAHAAPTPNPSRHRHTASISSITPSSSADPGSRPPSQHRQNSIDEIDESIQSLEFDTIPSPIEQSIKDRNPTDVQVVAHVKYRGNMRLSVTAEISLDYPMSSFVGIPLQLQITGFSFDGVAIVAHLNSKIHSCFLSPEDAQTFLGPEHLDEEKASGAETYSNANAGGLLEEIRVESEIGQKDGGKQVLKNVGKVEKFVLEQVRRIFEDEFVFPSFWTFLLGSL